MRHAAVALLALVLASAAAGAVQRGTDGDDTLVGSRTADVLYGFAGHDGLYGGAGDDLLAGGPPSRDWPSGDFSRRERLIGGAGDDVLRSHLGASVLMDSYGSNRFDSRDPLTDCHVKLPRRALASGGPRCMNYVLAGRGDDIVQARDGNLDFIQCGGGRDLAVVDRIDDVSADCERVRRR